MTTDRDRETAKAVMAQAPTLRNADAIAEVIAAALAAERARVLAPVLTLAELMDRDPWHKLRGDDAAIRIRRAAQDGES